MRLINTSTGELKEFIGDAIPSYAILSHRWSSTEEEVSYKDYRKKSKLEASGHEKIVSSCNVACSHGHDWAWIDTCCIDKRSSAELSEAINSMFEWYQNADQCYAYLSNVTSHWLESEWWHRGWTSQELIAPREILFYNQAWEFIGSRGENTGAISKLTGIPEIVFLPHYSRMYMHFTVAQKMSWAAGRRTTRIEDRAYSLLGLFHINMPLLYGEGSKAFRRLQLEIFSKYSDESLLAWMPLHEGPHLALAPSPDRFAEYGELAPHGSALRHYALNVDPSSTTHLMRPPRVTSWGLEICADACILQPLEGTNSTWLKDESLRLIAFKTAWAVAICELPCSLILVSSGSATPHSYQVFRRISAAWTECMELLRSKYHVSNAVPAQTFYLQFDDDFDLGDSSGRLDDI